MALQPRDIPPLGSSEELPLDRVLRIEQQLLAERARNVRLATQSQTTGNQFALAPRSDNSLAASSVAGSLLSEGSRRDRNTRASSVERETIPAPERPEPSPDLPDVSAPFIAEYPRPQGRSAIDASLQPSRVGHVYFQAEMPDHTIVYVREGAFALNGNGEVITSSGAILSPPLNVPQRVTSTTITRMGEVLVTTPDDVETHVVGRLPVYTFAHPEGLEDIGGGLFRSTGLSGAPQLLTAASPAIPQERPRDDQPIVGGAAGAVNAEVARQRFKEDLAAYRPNAPIPGQVINEDF